MWVVIITYIELERAHIFRNNKHLKVKPVYYSIHCAVRFIEHYGHEKEEKKTLGSTIVWDDRLLLLDIKICTEKKCLTDERKEV